MNKALLGLGALGAVSPVLMGAEGVPLPNGAPAWLPWLLSLLSPALLVLAGAAAKAVLAGLRAKAATEKNPIIKAVEENLADQAQKELEKKGL